MKSLSLLFKIANRFVLLGWLILFFLPLLPIYFKPMVMLIVITLLCALYSYLIIFGKHLDSAEDSIQGHFFSLKGVMQLFKSPRMVLAGWVHYLAFDLLAGLFIVSNAAHYDISHWLLLPCLFLALIFGPAGLLLYLVIRGFVTMDLLAVNFF